MPIKTSSAKAKGRRLQQLVRDLVLASFPFLEPDDCRSTGMGQNGEDLQLSPAARRAFPYSVECKSYANPAIYGWYEQAVANAGKSQPLLIVKGDRKKPLAVIDADHFFELLRKLHDYSKDKG